MNAELIKKIKTDYKTMLLSPRNQDWKNVGTENETGNKLSTNIPKGKITELNKLIRLR